MKGVWRPILLSQEALLCIFSLNMSLIFCIIMDQSTPNAAKLIHRLGGTGLGMSIQSDRWIREQALNHRLIEPIPMNLASSAMPTAQKQQGRVLPKL